MGYQHEHDNARARCAKKKKKKKKKCAYPGHTGCMVAITVRAIYLVNQLERLHSVSLPLLLFKLGRKKASCYRDLSETYLGTWHDFGE